MQITQEILNELLSYDPDTGNLTWKWRDVKWFKDGRFSAETVQKMWNSKLANKPAFTAADNNGYKIGRLNGKNYRAHRIIFLLVKGYLPEQVDHENHIRGDNRWENLKECTNKENSRNQTMRSTNTSGVMGVHWDKRDEKWIATIKVDDQTRFLGRFFDIQDAADCRTRALAHFNFHTNHGIERGA